VWGGASGKRKRGDARVGRDEKEQDLCSKGRSGTAGCPWGGKEMQRGGGRKGVGSQESHECPGEGKTRLEDLEEKKPHALQKGIGWDGGSGSSRR